MQYDIDGGNITVVIGEEARMDVPTALNYIKSGQDEIEATVNAGIDAFDLNAANKTTDYNDNASAKVTAYNNNATAKTDAFDLNASGKTNDFNDNYTIKKGLIDASVDAAAGSASAASASADLAQQWAVKMDGKVADEDYSAKYYADLASQSAGATGANKDLSNLTAAGEARFTAKQDVISDLSTIRSGAALGDTSVQLSGAQTITGTKTFTANILEKANIQMQSTTAAKGTAPESPVYQMLAFYDKNGFNQGNKTAQFYTTYVQSNNQRLLSAAMEVFKPVANSTDTASIKVYYPETGNAYTSAPAPTDDTTSSTQIDTVGARNTKLANYVTLGTGQTITGSKTFTSYIKEQRSNPQVELVNTDVTTGTSKNYDQTWWLRFEDTNGRTMGAIRSAYLKDSTNMVIYMRAIKSGASGDTDFADLSIHYPSSGDPFAKAPASDVDGSILTTVEEGTANNGWYAKLGNGWMIEQGIVTANNQTLTISLPKAFKSATSYSAVGTCNNAKAAYVTTQASSTFTLDASGGIGGTTIRWVAIGKWK